MTLETWRYVLQVLEEGSPPLLKKGQELAQSDYAFSRESCAEKARLIAQALFVKEGTKYGYRCVRVDYEPPDLDDAP